MQMEQIDSHLISERGHDSDRQVMRLRFRQPSGEPGPMWEYDNISDATYACGLMYLNHKEVLSFGQWFLRYIKADPITFPARKIEEEHAQTPIEAAEAKIEMVSHEDQTVAGNRMDLENAHAQLEAAKHQSEPAMTFAPQPEIVSSEPDKLKAAVLALRDEAAKIVIQSPDLYALAAKTVIAIVRMKDVAEKTLRPGIQERYRTYKDELAVLNGLTDPLTEVEGRLRSGMVEFDRKEKAERQRIADAERQELQRIADAEALEEARRVQLEDALEAAAKGEVELSEQIMQQPAPVPISVPYVPPVRIAPPIQFQGISHRENWTVEYYVNAQGKPNLDAYGNNVPDLNLIPLEYHLCDVKSVNAVAKRLKGRTNIPGVRVYDAGGMSVRKG